MSDEGYRHIFREIAGACRQSIKSLRVGFLGPWHSYSHLAAMKHFGGATEWVPLPSIVTVFEEVAKGQVDYAVVPLENSTDGRVVDTLSTFVRLPVKICAEVPLRVRHCLLGRGTRAEVQQVHSKPQALSQCRHWLATHLPAAELVAASSTAAAAQAASGDPRVAAIASQEAANEYDLRVLAEPIEDQPDNVTRFAVLGTESAARTGRDKTAVLFQVSHEPGALADAMAIFKRNRLNLTWIESFPSGRPDGRQEYMFFLEFQGHERELRSRKALAALAKKTQRLDILGSFPQWRKTLNSPLTSRGSTFPPAPEEVLMRRPFIAGNWKMNLDREASVDLAKAIVEGVADGARGRRCRVSAQRLLGRGGPGAGRLRRTTGCPKYLFRRIGCLHGRN